MRSKKVIYNAIAGLVLLLANTGFGLAFPRFVMTYYGSETNGLLQSITQFLSYITLLDAGISAVIRAKLYAPLAEGNQYKTQSIINSAKQFYRKIAYIFIAYLVVVAVLLPYVYSEYFTGIFTFSLILIIGIASFAEYYIGVSYTVLLEADQRKYIVLIIQSIAVICNLVVSVVLIKAGVSIHLVKIFTTLFFVIKPIVLSVYCNKKYNFKQVNKDSFPIENKWSGFGHHIAYFLYSHTDIVVLTFFKGPLLVSVYSVYNMVVAVLQSAVFYTLGGVEAAFGNMIALKEDKTLSNSLKKYEVLVFSVTTILYSTAAVTILDFVKIYTKGISDVNYIMPGAAIMLIIAGALYCVRKPYEALIMASGRLKETMPGAFIEAGINILFSILLVKRYGIVGVALGTVIATSFRTIQYMVYISKNIVKRTYTDFIKLGCTYGISALVICLFGTHLVAEVDNYLWWSFQAAVVFAAACIVVYINDIFFYKQDTIAIYKVLCMQFKRNK